MLAWIMMVAVQDAPLPVVTRTPLGSGRHILSTAAFPVSQSDAVDREQERIAKATCGSDAIGWGLLRRKGPNVIDRVPTYTSYSIEFQCLAPDTASYPRAPADWRPSAADEADVRAVFGHYYTFVDTGKFEAAHAMFDPRAIPMRDSWIENRRGTNVSLGTGTLRVLALHWEVNPADKRHPGVYVRVVFDGDYPAADAVCGDLTLYRRGPGDYVLTGEEFNFLLRRGAPMTPEAIAKTKGERCPR